MVNAQTTVARPPEPGASANTLCFLLDEDFVFRKDFAKELRRRDIDVVEFSDSTRFVEMVDDQSPDIVFINLNTAAPHQCVRALLALKECRYPGAVQLFGHCDRRVLESFNTIGVDCSLKMLPPITKPIKFATAHQIILDQKLGAPKAASSGISLIDALAKNLITFMYQPELDLKTNMMVGVEVVARVAHPTLGFLAPAQFLKGADEDALLKLSRMALVKAIQASARFRELGVALKIAINIGVDDLLRLPIADLVSMHRPQQSDWLGIVLEVPERQVINRIDSLQARIINLQKSSVTLAIDNFGCGSSCLSALNQIPFSEIKIDRSLVQDCATNKGHANICKTIIQMAHNFGARAVAVGVSNEADLRMLAGFDCDFAQGFLLGKPMNAEQIEALIVSFKSRSH